ncbi:DHS-like NAD/FAD-binding domain-containing protein [Emericellopsis atlantica]|uniref:DHS-like NAD/FAD-binding domain-containing protein n=1 Tax=Emericellopsis atlantica TaxID=2614577 RepID=A0A9P7ZD79_9HYPO|nr:DHS-like NAD/FAD-binding domain-containing protein [Emericellopsis atlantica]KAG9249667.1 DHS-like NAD/FAD-binding domain-containing protein [Emericellopsis atlantica]
MDRGSSPLSSPPPLPSQSYTANPLPTPSASSSPLSNISRTPSIESSPEPVALNDLSHRYPSPMSTTTASGSHTPVKRTVLPTAPKAKSGPKKSRLQRSSPPESEDGQPAPKKRKVGMSSKERTTEYLDLMKDDTEWTDEDDAQLERLTNALKKKKKIVVIAGAGISVAAGIPDFRSSTGLFAPAGCQPQKMKASGKHLFDASVYKSNDSTSDFHTMVREMAHMSDAAKPTRFHHLLASLAHQGRLLRLYTQNIDCIDTSMEPLATNVPLNPKGPWPVSVQLHGGLKKMVCSKCAELQDLEAELFDGPEAPLCATCVDIDHLRTSFAGKRSHGIGRMRPRFVLYNEHNPDADAIGAVTEADLKARPDAVIVVGTSLKVPGTRRIVKEMCLTARGRRDGFTAFINLDSEPKHVDFKDCWDMVVRAKCDKVALHANLPLWDDSAVAIDSVLSPEQALQAEALCSSTDLSVAIPSSCPSSQKGLDIPAPVAATWTKQTSSVLTPKPSPKLATAKPKAKPKPKPKAKKVEGNVEKSSPALQSAATRNRKPLAKARPSTLAGTFKAVKTSTNDTSKAKAAIKIEPTTKPFTAHVENELGADSTAESKLEAAPTTPTGPLQPASRDIVSPSSIPKGMGRLLN